MSEAPESSPADPSLAETLIWQLQGGYAHDSFEMIVTDFPNGARTLPSGGASHSPWEILVHLRICQQDLLAYTRFGLGLLDRYDEPDFPDDLWPITSTAAPPTDQDWDSEIESYLEDRQRWCALVREQASQLTTPLAKIDGRTVLRQLVIVIDHAAYHLGQLAVMRRTAERGTGA